MFDDHSPIYRQIADQIKAAILTGELKGDDQVMSTIQYASFYRINPATAAKAFQGLVDEGILYKKRGIGMFVSPTAHDTLMAQHREQFFQAFFDPMVAEARAVGIPIADLISRLQSLPGDAEEDQS